MPITQSWNSFYPEISGLELRFFSYLFTEGGGFQGNKSLILWILAPHGFIFVEKKAEKHFWKNIMFTKESHKNNGIIFM